MPTTNEALPEYAATVAECGDPQPTIDELTEQLDAQNSPKLITTSVLIQKDDELDEPDDEPPHEPPKADHG